jgi:2-hydroxy-3-oxopropionate reductase
MKVGFIGLGLMGRPMALNLIKGGHTVTVWARRPAAMAPLAEAGAAIAASPAELAANCEIVISMVGDGPDVEAVMLGQGGVSEGGKPGLLAIDMSTIAPATARHVAAKLAEKGIDFLDAPVSGGDIGAQNGTLSIMVGGKAEAFERAQAVFVCLGKNIVRIGDTGAGQVTKAANNLVVALSVIAVSEAYCLAEKSGVDPAKVREALLGGFAYSRVLEVHGQRMLDGSFKPGFKAWMHQKDLNIALRSAQDVNVGLPATALAAQLYNATVAQGWGEDDTISVFRLLQKMSGLAA